MSSPGTGMESTPEEARDLLHKLITESIKVRAVFENPSIGVFSLVVGIVEDAGTGVLTVSDPALISGVNPQFRFKPSLASVRKYADARGFVGADFAASKLASVLVFAFPDGSRLAIFETVE